MLQTRAERSKSKVLALAAARVEQGGPFDKIVQMIKDMITKLTEEAAEEAEHKAWCDGELATSKQTREAKTATIDQLMATSEKLTSEIQKLAEEIADLQAGIAELDKAIADATKLRQEEKAENTVAIADAKAAQEAVQSAIGVLKSFYEKAAKATSFAQGPADDAPASFTEPYKGNTGSAGGVMGMLDVILSDFVRLDEETSSEEEAAQREFDAFMKESNADRSAKSDSSDSKSKSKTSKEKELNQAQEDLAELKTACIDADVSYEERVAGREE